MICFAEECEIEFIGKADQKYCSYECRPSASGSGYSNIIFDVPMDTPPTKIYKCVNCERSFTCPGRARKYCSEICSSRSAKLPKEDRNIVFSERPIQPVGSRGAKIGAGTVYVIGHSSMEGPVKLGKSAIGNAERRLRDLQSGNPRTLSILGSADVEDCDLIENLLHNVFREKRLSGEWFDITPREAFKALGINQLPTYSSLFRLHGGAAK